jgi:hypothetical protein
MSIITDYMVHSIPVVFKHVPGSLQVALQYVQQYSGDIPTLGSKLNALSGGNYLSIAALKGVGPSEAVDQAIATAGGAVMSDDIAFKVRVGDPAVPLDNSQTDLTSAYNNLGDLALRNSGTLTHTDLSSTAAIVSGQILNGTLVNADFSSTAAVVGSNLTLFMWASSLAPLSSANCHVLSGTSGTPTITATALTIATTFTGQGGIAPATSAPMTTENAFELLAYCSQCVLPGETVLCFNAWSDPI